MFQSIDPAPPDPILGLTEAFNNDPCEHKVNLTVGIYKNDEGRTPILACVRDAEQKLLTAETSKSYLPINGSPTYGRAVRALLLGSDDPKVDDGRAVTCQTPGGTGALRVAGDFLKQHQGVTTIHLPDPSWANHQGIFKAAGLNVKSYRYFDQATHTLNLQGMIEDLNEIADGDVVLFHGCCHNPTGVDPTDAQWQQIADALAGRGVLALVDMAYQGLADGHEADAAGLRILASKLPQMMVCSSFSKNFSLYNERVGALTLIADSPELAAAVLSHVKLAIRTNYSNPPAHGGLIVQTILGDPALTQTWQQELAEIRNRINMMRKLLREKLDEHGAVLSDAGNAFVENQRGMFTLTGLGSSQVETLRTRHAIYIVNSGRINIAGLTHRNIDHVCKVIAAVTQG